MISILGAAALFLSPAISAGMPLAAATALSPATHDIVIKPVRGDKVFAAFGGKDGIDRIADRFVAGVMAHRRTADLIDPSDHAKARQAAAAQFCFVLGGPCPEQTAEIIGGAGGMGLSTAQFNAMLEELQAAMWAEGIPNWAQARLIAKLAPMHRVMVTR